MELYRDILPRLQEVNEYGGGSEVFLFREAVFNAVDEGANANDQTLVDLRRDMQQRIAAWRDIEDHTARSSLFDTYCEATFYLATAKRIMLEGIPRSSSSTPDFRTYGTPHIQFEIKTLDIAAPITNYSRQMAEGLDSNIKAHEDAKRKGIGFGETVVAPHGSAETWVEVIEQTMRKLSGTIKVGQYANAPTFLVANLGRLSVRVDSEQLKQTRTIPSTETDDGKPASASGDLWAIANHRAGDNFDSSDLCSRYRPVPIERAGILRDYPFIQGVIFTEEPWSAFQQAADWRDAYPFLGIWNEDCTANWNTAARNEAHRVLRTICSHVVSTR